MGLSEYHQKRQFSQTPEPQGDPSVDSASANQFRFVVQKHDARNLHYDLRLEMDGVLLSWAIPKGPSLDPAQKRLAIHVEDHPLEYLHFEGVIPKGEYGGGTVLVWDTGTWAPVNANGYATGDFKFELDGEKLQGRWMLVHTGKRKKTKQWLLFKERDGAARDHAEFDVLTASPASILTGRTIDQVAEQADAVWPAADTRQTQATVTSRPDGSTATADHSGPLGELTAIPGNRRSKMPSKIAPMLPTSTKSAPTGNRWVHEIKYDGYRMLAHIENKQVRFFSRNGHDWSDKLPKLRAELAQLPVETAVIDGEVAFVTDTGTTDFQALQNTIGKGRDQQLTYYAFDLLHLDGHDLTGCQLIDRKAVLANYVPHEKLPSVLFSDHIEGDGPIVFQQACQLGTEGIVSKLAAGKYVEGRTSDWLKKKAFLSHEFVLGGYTESTTKQPFGSLIVGAHNDAGELIYVGRVGTGFNARTMADLAMRFAPLATTTSPFINAADCKPDQPVHWLEPQLAIEVEYAAFTRENILRHPSYRGLRDDVPLSHITLASMQSGSVAATGKQRVSRKRSSKAAPGSPSAASTPKAAVQRGDLSKIQMTNPERLMYPSAGVTKIGIATYYAQVAERMLPHVVDRPLALVRCPQGYGEKCFFQKSRAQGMPDSLQEVQVTTAGKKPQSAMIVRDLAGVISLVQFSALEIHTWCCQVDRPDRPDKIIFDLDPDESLPFARVASAAILLRDLLGELGLESFVKTTGGKGLHVVVPIVRTLAWSDAKRFAFQIGKQMVARSPGRFTTSSSKPARRGKIYIDYLRNTFGATAIAAYSTRSRPTASVATPIHWEEVTTIQNAAAFTVTNFPRRLETQPADPWAELLNTKQTITKAMLRAVEIEGN
jgi:bifunctional non-homologous end joining protein LigD